MANFIADSLECVICGAPFKPTNQVQMTCSKRCSKKLTQRRVAQWRQERKTPLKERKCKNCGKTFMPSTATNVLCSKGCAKKSQESQAEAWQKKHYRRNKSNGLKQRFGITFDQWETMYKQQEGKCLICDEQKDPMCVDHNHETGQVRGLLCRQCNAGIGSLKDSPELLRKAAKYIETRDRSYHEQKERRNSV